jgi:hypothetical protein
MRRRPCVRAHLRGIVPTMTRNSMPAEILAAPTATPRLGYDQRARRSQKHPAEEPAGSSPTARLPSALAPGALRRPRPCAGGARWRGASDERAATRPVRAMYWAWRGLAIAGAARRRPAPTPLCARRRRSAATVVAIDHHDVECWCHCRACGFVGVAVAPPTDPPGAGLPGWRWSPTPRQACCRRTPTAAVALSPGLLLLCRAPSPARGRWWRAARILVMLGAPGRQRPAART